MCSACNVVKYLKPGEELYTGADIKVESKDRVDEKKIRKDLEKILRPKPNQTIGHIRFKLWFYYVAGEDPKKGFKKFLDENIENPKSEYLIPFVADQWIKAGEGVIKVIPTSSQWFGVTYKEDAPVVQRSLNQQVESGAYPASLWNAVAK